MKQAIQIEPGEQEFEIIIIQSPTPIKIDTPISGIIYYFNVETQQEGWFTTGLWHITTSRYNSSDHSFFYGNENIKNYDTGSANSGGLVFFDISLENTNKPVLYFMSWYQTESDTSKDKKLVQISVNNGPWTDLKQISHTKKTWVKEQIDISSYAGETVQIRFFFDTIDEKYNMYEGWYIDNVEIRDV